MPAISLLKLDESAHQIRSLLEKPEDLSTYMISFFETYADQTFHPGEKSLIDSRLPFYRIPSVITKKLTQEFEKAASQEPDKALLLVDFFWQNRHFESRYFACVILGNMPLRYSSQVLAILEALLLRGVEPFFLETLFSTGTRTIRQDSPSIWCDQAQKWLQKESVRWKSYGLLAYKILLADDEYQDLPNIMQGLFPFFKEPHPLLINDGISLFQTLLSSFPEEIDFYISDILTPPSNTNRDLMLRKALSQYSPAKFELFRSRL